MHFFIIHNNNIYTEKKNICGGIAPTFIFKESGVFCEWCRTCFGGKHSWQMTPTRDGVYARKANLAGEGTLRIIKSFTNESSENFSFHVLHLDNMGLRYDVSFPISLAWMLASHGHIYQCNMFPYHGRGVGRKFAHR